MISSDFPETADRRFVLWKTLLAFFFLSKSQKHEASLVYSRYMTMTIVFTCVLTFPKPLCNNVLQPSPLCLKGCNTVSHSGLAYIKTWKRMFYSLIITHSGFQPCRNVQGILLC